MNQDDRRIIDMTLEGEFTTPPYPTRPPLLARLMLWGVVTAVLALAVLIVAISLWFVAMILPVVLAVALIGWVALRFQLWRAGGRSFTIRRWP